MTKENRLREKIAAEDFALFLQSERLFYLTLNLVKIAMLL